MSNAEQLLEQVGVSDRRVTPEMADEMRRSVNYWKAELPRLLANMYRTEGVPIHSGELRAAIEAARVHWTDDEIAGALGLSWNRIEQCMWGKDYLTGARSDTADCALHGGHRTALESLARNVWMVAPRQPDPYDDESEVVPEPEPEPVKVATRTSYRRRRVADLNAEARAARDAIRAMLVSLRPMTVAEVALATGIATRNLTDAAGYAVSGTITVRQMKAWLATEAGKAALSKATGKAATRGGRQNIIEIPR